MECPRCQYDKSAVTRTGPAEVAKTDGTSIPAIARKRVCEQCGLIFTTTEIIQNVQIYDRMKMKAKYVSPKKFEELERQQDKQEALWD